MLHLFQKLQTNCRRLKKNTYEDHSFETPLSFEKGQEFGEFNLGCTIVLLFEAPTNFEYNMELGARIKVGEGLYHQTSPQAKPGVPASPSK